MEADISQTDPPSKEESESVVFKVPVIGKKVATKKEKQSQTEPKQISEKDLSESLSSTADKTETRPLISFQPKSLTLPSQVYKPHRPSASEYIEHYYKMEKEGKQPKIHGLETKSALDDKSEKKDSKSDEHVKVKSNAKQTKLSYSKPDWSTPCETENTKAYSLEVLKSGTIVDRINLSTNEYFVFGRLSDCDVTLEHPSISRYHAVLQFGMPTETDDVEFQKDGSSGFYLFDLGSTHGTFLNKAPVPSKKYYRVKVGHMMKFGGSSRVYILQGPQADEEAEAEETATELVEKARAKRKKEELAKMMMGDDSEDDDDDDDGSNEDKRSTSCPVNKDTGVTWGMLEDAVAESDEEREDENKDKEPVFSLEDQKEKFYVKDPHKALKNFYDKEGMEIDFECTERRPGQWNVRLELPVDTASGNAVVAEASITGKKRDAINNCALEACRLLDKHEMFKQSEHHRRKVKEWEKEDFYDSDEDQYLDRTGELDKKRQLRKQRIGVKATSKRDDLQTYESLKNQIDELEKEISEIEDQLEKDKNAVRTKEGSSDPLEEFMKQVKAGKTLDSVTRSKLKQRLLAIRKESARLSKLADVARPASLPALSSKSSKSMPFVGRMKGKKKVFSMPTQLPPAPVYKPLRSNEDVEEEEEEEEAPTESSKQAPQDKDQQVVITSSLAPPDNAVRDDDDDKSFVQPDEIKIKHSNGTNLNPPEKDSVSSQSDNKTSANSTSTNKSNRKRMFGPTLPQDLKDRLLGVGNDNNNVSNSKSKKVRKKSAGDKSAAQPISNDPNYADWLPPQNQTGDGTTSLNAKYGY